MLNELKIYIFNVLYIKKRIKAFETHLTIAVFKKLNRVKYRDILWIINVHFTNRYFNFISIHIWDDNFHYKWMFLSHLCMFTNCHDVTPEN